MCNSWRFRKRLPSPLAAANAKTWAWVSFGVGLVVSALYLGFVVVSTVCMGLVDHR